jgi:hypothetical protein
MCINEFNDGTIETELFGNDRLEFEKPRLYLSKDTNGLFCLLYEKFNKNDELQHFTTHNILSKENIENMIRNLKLLLDYQQMG